VKLGFARFIARALPHLAFFAVMLVSLSSEAGAYWQCEGRPCGATPWTCCCVTAPSACESACGAPNSIHFEPRGAHADGCHCSSVSQDNGKTTFQRHFSFSPNLEICAVLPTVPVFEAVPALEILSPVESRGPPLSNPALASPSLRAPPVA